MKKILLIGELGEIVRSLNECLTEDFQVQLCTEEIASIQAMIKILKPDMLVICHIGMEEIDRAVFEWIQEKCPQIPTLGIATKEDWQKCKEFYMRDRVDVLLRPVAKQELLRKCYQMLNEEERVLRRRRQKTPNSRYKIMLVDDSAIMLRSMKSILERRYDICLAKSGERALKMIPVENPDLILLDYEMEGMDGKATFEAIKADEFMQDIPVVFLTGVADRRAIYSVLKSKPDDYILKPPDETRILETIKKILKD